VIGRFGCFWIDLAALFSGVPVEGRSLVTIPRHLFIFISDLQERIKESRRFASVSFQRSMALSVHLGVGGRIRKP